MGYERRVPTAPLRPGDRERLIKLLGLLGSDFDGEISAAGRKAAEFLRQRKLMWTMFCRRSRHPRRRHPGQQRSPGVKSRHRRRSDRRRLPIFCATGPCGPAPRSRRALPSPIA
jgi:hypothetical protein